MTCSYTCTEQILYRNWWLCIKNQKSRFLIASKRVGLSSDIWLPQKLLWLLMVAFLKKYLRL